MTLKSCPDTYAEFRGWLEALYASLLSCGVEPVSCLQYIRELQDPKVSWEALSQTLTPALRGLDIKLYAAVLGALQSKGCATHLHEIGRQCTFENGRYGCGRIAVRILQRRFRDEAKIQATEANQKLWKTLCHGAEGIGSFLDVAKECRHVLVRCGEPVSDGMFLQVLKDRLEGVGQLSATFAEFEAREEKLQTLDGEQCLLKML